jgi:hypothetical protein
VNTPLKSISVEADNKYFRVDDHSLVNVVPCKLIHTFDTQNQTVIPAVIKVCGSSSFKSWLSWLFLVVLIVIVFFC